ncbi:Voltage gated chloride channel family protein [Trichomonas vaginalis G3]|uniref:Voltage gated chloride channel family protein n=1 Tax=Trichomonas vaginalis (strain ATCC PRA-98 / G3) TaxID=412133 RepID=A2FMI5_TRIV3|nr:voltage-gated chloride channel protein [Trichomonas vaginalis G3]EAX93884.1 Voltage gated chloride channel family protein [Trichomonas vaginalis G3]KAI5541530.1 voltage-gated chloride channel protein [Trichomonas vaginalis G3]|eukprot:XP_001306814.1 Voltage gated chloride channel family protein [Trichomonas vaginalis G3]
MSENPEVSQVDDNVANDGNPIELPDSNVDIESQKEAIPQKTKKYKRRKQYFTFLKKLFLPLVAVGLATGVCCGGIIGTYQFLAELLVDKSKYLFSLVRKDLRWLPLAFFIDILIGLGIGLALEWFSEIRGSGIPYIESVARGNLGLTWYISLPAMFVVSLSSLFSGLSLGSEGPSVYLGGCIGYGFAKLIKMNHIHDMLLVAAGSSAGLAVAFDAPLSGLIFALEEVYRKFSTQIILVSVICVSVSQIITHLIFHPRIMLINDIANEKFNIITFLVAIFCGLSGGFMGALFNLGIRRARNLYKYAKFLPMKFYVIIPEVLAVVLCTFFPDAGFGGATVLKKVLNNELKVWEIATCFAIRFISILICFGSKASGGIFIPMLSIGGLWGGLVAKLMVLAGYDSTRYTYMVLMVMSSFFTGVVRAPLTAVILPVEFTMQFCGWLGPTTAVAWAYIIAEVMRIEPLYEKLMEALVEKRDEDELQDFEEFSFLVTLESMVCGLTVREVILPEGTLITHILRDKTPIFPTENTQIIDGDEVFFKCSSEEIESAEEQMSKLF